MKTKILKSTKRILGLALAICVLAVSLFTANVGVNINADAAVTETNSDVWDGSLIKPTEQDNGTYIIRTAEEFAWVALSSQHTTEANYKVADGIKYFNMNGKKGITFNSTAADVEAAELTGTNWANGETSNPNFKGTIDGNGVIIFNIYATGAYAGLFPYIINAGENDSPRATATVKNINVTSSYFTAYHSVGGIVGFDPGYPTSLTIDGCSVTNCCLINYGKSDATKSEIGGIAGNVDHNKTIVNNCFVGGNKMVADKIVSGFVGNSTNNASVTISNSICIDALPYATKVATTEPNTKVTTGATYTNVYTNSNFDSATYTTIKNVVSGQDAVNQMALDFNVIWFANTMTYPMPRALHSFNVTNNGNGTHSEVCTDCDLIGVPANHFYNEIDKVNNISKCYCGACIDGIFDIWDSEGAIADFEKGTGTEKDPYIIENVEQLFKMVRQEGVDANGNALYYKVADGINALYINDTRAMSQSDFNAAAAAGTLNNWSYGLLTDTERCPQGGSCGATHLATYTYTFSGYFDGNGVTVYGLYSETDASKSSYWATGTGFVPGLADNAVIANTIFDTVYIENSEGYAAVITSSFGAWTGRYSDGFCDSITYRVPGDSLAVIKNVVIRNAYVTTTYSPELTSNGYVSGFVAAHMQSEGLKIQNCLFDGSNSTLVSTATNKYYAGMFSTPSSNTYAVQISDSLVANSANSFDVAYLGGTYNTGYNFIYNSYAYGVSQSTYDTLNTSDYTTISGMPMLNWTAWDIDAVEIYGTPMPKISNGWEYRDFRHYKNAFKNSEYYTNPEGATPVDEGYEQGVFSDFDELVGSGTESDPYIIDNANLLFEIIASGGTNRGIGQYFKLACDLDLGGIQWVNYQTAADRNDTYNKVYYQYKPFAGTIDGDGHTITGMHNATANAGEYAGFIPELASTGAVKNIHFRDSYAYSTVDYGIVAGTAASGSQIINCSIDGCENAKFVGSNNATIKNSYITVGDNTSYYLESGKTGTPEVDGVIWYQGGAEGSKPQLVDRADAMPCADVDGDGDGYEYAASDLVALKNKLLRKSAYAYVYGDVSRNGITDIRDLVALQREIADDKVQPLDGFWKNVKAGNISIYYDETDNYDFARKMELYLEEVTGVDVAKALGTTTANQTVRIVTNTSLGANNYSVAFDAATCVLTISGGSFTAVEQGVLAFIENSNVVNGTVYTGTGSLENVLNINGEAYKSAVTVGGQTYHYVWGDEFDEAVNGTVSYDKWLLRNKNIDKTLENDDDSDDHEYEFAYISAATDAQAPGINVVSDGKLTLKRGINSQTDMYASGISSKNSMLYKRGYAEMLVTLPSDGYAFPAWWLLTRPSSYSNYGIQRSLYGKVYELNNSGTYKFDGTTSAFSADDPTTFQYKLPTQTLEIDIFEIIQKVGTAFSSSTGWTRKAVASTDYDVSFNIHKWYTYATVKDDTTLTVYDLDWANIETNGGFTNKLLTATGSNGENYSLNSGNTIKVNTANLADGSVNGAITYEGGYSNTSGETNSMNVDMNSYRSNGQVKQLKYGFLWTDTEMTFSIYDGTTKVYSATVTLADLNFQNGEDWTADQYAYMLIENHWYTATYRSADGKWYYVKDNTGISACDMVIDYVRLYQLNDARDIVTPETEAFNSSTRW